MTKHDSPINGWIDQLVSTHPPKAALVVGAGRGLGLWTKSFEKLEGLRVILVEAQPDHIPHLRQVVAARNNWQCSHSLLAAEDGITCFHEASMESESGLLTTSELLSAWPNIREIKSDMRQATTIARLRQNLDVPPNWLWIDCMPALEIFSGLGEAITDLDVICMRGLNCEGSKESSLDNAVSILRSAGFGLVSCHSERNPMIGHALFARGMNLEPQDDSPLPDDQDSHEPVSNGHSLDLADIGTLKVPAGITGVVEATLRSDDIPLSISNTLHHGGFAPAERFHYLVGLAGHVHQQGDRTHGAGLLEEASRLLDVLPSGYKWHLVKNYIRFGQVDDAYELVIRHLAQGAPLDPSEISMLAKANHVWREKILNNKGHGQEVLLAFLKRHAERYRELAGDSKPVFIEIGTTRESASGQGSTRRIMEFCARESFHFITVDMDSANTEMAAAMFRNKRLDFEAVHSKGEDYLAAYSGRMDCVFLDAYDFDHGMHSERRQSRYEKFLGSRIDEQQCHQMHLDCARAVVDKLTPGGVVCVDDTWLLDGSWTAKGTLAVPYLLECGYHLLDVRNKSALLGERKWLDSEVS